MTTFSKRTLLAAMAAMPAAALLIPAAARADIEVNVTHADVQPLPISIPAFGGPRGADIAGVISANLQRSGLFKIVDPATSTDRDLTFSVQPLFPAWQKVNAQALIVGQSTAAPDRMVVGFHLYDVFAEHELGFNAGSGGLQFTATPENWRRIAHKISDAIYERLTGEKGYFDTRIVFVAEKGGRGSRTKTLAIMDQDGANPSYLTDGSATIMTPRFSANSQEITYMELRPDGSKIYLLNLETGRSENLGDFKGMVFAPRFSPDGGKVAFSLERGGNTDIFVMDLKNRATTRLTVDPAIDTSPSFSPDGSRIAFESDRSGTPQIYIMGADGSNPRRISFGQGRYNTPVWSPTGEFIAFTRQAGGQFSIGVMKPDGADERILTGSYLDESPAWAPNGRVLLFSRQGANGQTRLWSVDLTGRIVQPMPYPGGASDAAWSPLLN